MSSSRCLAPRLITLDSTNTLLRLRKPVGELYLEQLREVRGTDASAEVLEQRFGIALARQSQRSPSFGAADDGCRAWWRTVVAETLEGARMDDRDFELIFQKLYDTFAGQEAWELFPHTKGALDSLRHWCDQNSCQLGVLSNMDDRLEAILQRLDIRDQFDFVLTSYAAGVEKPAPEIFETAQAIATASGDGAPPIAPHQCLHCGDSMKRDLRGALHAGWSAAVLDSTVTTAVMVDCSEDSGTAALAAEQSAWKLPDLSHLPGLLEE